mmetsp:Transcript_30304/g.55352  ORF Transcript_30304/g.55352 Transcript_30304/m.55352 type:complete len:288 (+) Transcript_30304:167-1030(+)
MDLRCLSALAHLIQVPDMRPKGRPEVWKERIPDFIFFAHLHDNWCNGRVVVLRHCGEQVVRHLVVERPAEEGHQLTTVRVVHRALHLRERPLLLLHSRVAPVVVRALGGHVRDLEVEGQPVARGQLGHQPQQPEVGRPQDQQGQRHAPGDVARLGGPQLRVAHEPDRVHAHGAVVLAVERACEVLQAELDAQDAVQGRQVQVLEAVHPGVGLLGHQPARVALHGRGQVRVNLEHVRVDVVADRVLVQPGGEVRPREEVHEETAGRLPATLGVPPGRVARIMHDVQQR